MYGVRHNLAQDFPEFRGEIDFLKTNDETFSRLLDKYQQTDKKICGYEQQRRPVTDSYMEQLKRWRVRLKDELYFMLKRTAEQNAT